MSKIDGRVSHTTQALMLTNWQCRLGLTKTGQGSRIEAAARGMVGFIVPGNSLYEIICSNLTMC
jgi:hypothetical protein